jgi:hypothetical protein
VGEKARLIKALWVYLGSDMNEMFPAPSLPSMCFVCNVSGGLVTEEEVTFDCSTLSCRAVVVTARSELFKFEMKPGIFHFHSIFLHFIIYSLYY